MSSSRPIRLALTPAQQVLLPHLSGPTHVTVELTERDARRIFDALEELLLAGDASADEEQAAWDLRFALLDAANAADRQLLAERLSEARRALDRLATLLARLPVTAAERRLVRLAQKSLRRLELPRPSR